MTEGYGRKHFKHARFQFRDIVSVPVRDWMALPPARKTATAYRALTDVPVELASAGFTVTIAHTAAGWSITVEKQLTELAVLHLQGEAASFATALFQLAEDAETVIDDLERMTRRAWEKSRESVAA